MSTDHPRDSTPSSRPPQSPPSEGPSQGPAEGRRGGINRRCAVPDRASLRVCELAQAQSSRRVLRGDRATQAGNRHQRHRARQDHDDAQPGAAQRPAWLRQGWAAHVGCRMPRALGATESCEAGHGGMDDHSRIGRAPGGRRTPHASGAQRISHPDDGASRVAWRGCERPVARTFPHHLCPVRVDGSGRSEMASRSRRKSELSRPWVRDAAAIHIRARLSTTSLRVTRVPWNG